MAVRPSADGIPIFCAFDALVPTEDITGNPRNPNRHPAKQVDLLAKIIAAQGWRAPITISTRSGYVVRGHGRLAAARALEKAQVPVDYQDYENEAAEWADMIADNRLAELASADFPTLAELLSDLEAGAFDVSLTGFDEQWVADARAKMEVMASESDYSELLGPAIKREPAPKGTGTVTVTIVGPETVLTEEATTDLRKVWSAAGAKVTLA